MTDPTDMRAALEREAFERIFGEMMMLSPHEFAWTPERNAYDSLAVHWAWKAWQTARATLASTGDAAPKGDAEDAARLAHRATVYEEAFRIAYQATYQSHNGHWDSTMRGGLGCPECIRAREARENCDRVIREGLGAAIDAARKEGA